MGVSALAEDKPALAWSVGIIDILVNDLAKTRLVDEVDEVLPVSSIKFELAIHASWKICMHYVYVELPN